MLDVVVVNWNAGPQLRECVASIDKYGAGFVKKTIVVDNGSQDGSDGSLDDFANVTVIRAGSNLGFGKACNLGARHATSEYLLFLNPDAALYPDTLFKVLAYMQDPENSKTGICGVQLLDETGHIARSCARFPSLTASLAHSAGLVRFFPRLGYAMTEWDHGQTRKVDQVIGAFFLVRRKLFETLNGFDERFFVYFEEVDFSYRARQADWVSVYLADAQAFHAGGGTSNQVKAHRLFYSLRSRVLYAFKHFSLLSAIGVLLTTLLIEPLSRSALALLRRSLSNLKETWAAYRMLWHWLPQWVLKGVTR
ncbi:glycosyltransferase family 2 protein [Variovorax sp. KBS0712]|uniref:glycosyltransferase family 2 protein n=1 Tax=Variovorax sp. KBS0712 TaxID=2578111 RepID=UPI001118CD21|nr:glycosyltransferase family 2 protein [Variovorax sp. KBS0712]TSD54707.1 glycosyltransferase family 2 protein [Variovorax sp. KBS0712]